VAGNTFSLEMIDFPDRLVVGQSMTARVAIHVNETGSDERVPAQIQTWTETPFGRAYLSNRTRRLRPGHTTSVPVALVINTIRPADFAPFPATFGVSVTIKNETLEATHDLLIAPHPVR
jgi:hypothetical protein